MKKLRQTALCRRNFDKFCWAPFCSKFLSENGCLNIFAWKVSF